jgi:ubiquinone/menaquinone biosynthesis C-methylase UbiE
MVVRAASGPQEFAVQESLSPVLVTDRRFWDGAARKYAASPVSDPEGWERTLARTAAWLAPDQQVLELGCGTGSTALRLAPKVGRYLATDLSVGMIEIARERLAKEPRENLEFRTGTAETLAEAEPGRFDVVLGFNYLHLVEDPARTLASVHRLLKPGGSFVSKTVCLKEMNPLVALAIPVLRAFGKAPATVQRLHAAMIVQALRSAGFEIEADERHGSRGHDPRPFLVARR